MPRLTGGGRSGFRYDAAAIGIAIGVVLLALRLIGPTERRNEASRLLTTDTCHGKKLRLHPSAEAQVDR